MLVTFVLVKVIEKRFQSVASDALVAVSDSMHEALTIWAREQRLAALDLAKNQELHSAVQVLLDEPHEATALLASPSQSKLREFFHNNLQYGRYRGFFIIGPGNISLASSRDANVGLTNPLVSQPDILNGLWSGETKVSRIMQSDVSLTSSKELFPQKNNYTQFVGTPITDETGRVIALLTLRNDPNNSLFPLLEQGRIGDTGETYAFDTNGVLLSASRFEERAQGNRRVIIKEDGEYLTGYPDYRSIPVIGVWRWHGELGFGLTTEQNVSEAYNLFYTVRGLIYLSVFMVTLVLFVLLVVSLRGRSQIVETQEKLASIVNSTSDGVVLIDLQGSITSANPALGNMFGYPVSVMEGMNVNTILSNPTHFLEIIDNLNKGMSIHASGSLDGRRADGSIFPIEFSLNILRLTTGQYCAAILRDVDERHKSENNLRLYATAFENSVDAILITDADNRIVAVNQAFTKHTGFELADVAGKDPKILSAGSTSPETYQAMWASLEDVGFWQGELWDRRKDGGVYPKWVSISRVLGDKGKVLNYIASFIDISERKEAEERINKLAHHDALTGLLNRLSLDDRLQQELSSTRRVGGSLALLFLDLDRFKTINDTMGHHAGDLLLIEVADRLKSCVRDSDIVARLGGDEFVVVLTGLENATSSATVAANIIEALSNPYQVGGGRLPSSASIGISVFPEDGEDSTTLMKNADIAMYHAKEQGRNNFQFFTNAMNVEVQERTLMEHDLHRALKQEEFELYYQPQVSGVNGNIVGMEALIRWNHPRRGFVSPDQFIPLSEELGLIDRIGNWVLDEACHQLSIWKSDGFDDFKMAVNLSPNQLVDTGFVSRVRKVMDKYAISAGELELEVTETQAMKDPERTIQQLKAIRDLGIELAVDDFGTGYSSLAYLKRLPIQSLKLDRSFVKDIETDTNDAAISAATLALAHSLDLAVVAEGVETPEQLTFLRSHQCEVLQGYLFSRPLPADKVMVFLQQTADASDSITDEVNFAFSLETL